METLKLEHIAPFVLSGLKGRNRDTKQDYNLLGLDIARNSVYVLGSGTFPGFLNVKLFAPILHPLSSLTKPIHHNGEEFVPLEKFYEILDCRTAINEKDVRIDIETIIKHGIEMDTDWIYVKKFYEWKIVVDIPEHLWIDVNTLKENPYKIKTK